MKAVKDKTSVDKNSKAKPINYPPEAIQKNKAGDEIAKIIKKENRDVEYKFTETEMQEKGKKLAAAVIDKAKIVEEKKVADDGFKMRIDAEQTKVDLLSEEIARGFEIKTMTVEVHRNFTSGKREYWYKGVKQGEDKLTSMDHQLEVFDDLNDTKGKKREFDLDLQSGDWIVTKKGTVVQITEDDVIHGINKKNIDRLATQEEINAALKGIKA